MKKPFRLLAEYDLARNSFSVSLLDDTENQPLIDYVEMWETSDGWTCQVVHQAEHSETVPPEEALKWLVNTIGAALATGRGLRWDNQTGMSWKQIGGER